MDAANKMLAELNSRVQAGDVDGGMAALSKIKVSLLTYLLTYDDDDDISLVLTCVPAFHDLDRNVGHSTFCSANHFGC
jgi:hypothetical protein